MGNQAIVAPETDSIACCVCRAGNRDDERRFPSRFELVFRNVRARAPQESALLIEQLAYAALSAQPPSP